MFVNIILITVGIFTYTPRTPEPVTSTGKTLLSIASVNGLIHALFAFVDSVYLTKSDRVNPDEPYKIRRRIASDFMVTVRLNSFMSIVVYGSFVYHIIIKDFELKYTFLVPLVDVGVCLISWGWILLKSKTSSENSKEFTSLFNPFFNYMRFMIWAKMIHSWSIRWVVPLLPFYAFGWLIAVPGLCMAAGVLC